MFVINTEFPMVQTPLIEGVFVEYLFDWKLQSMELKPSL